MTKADFLRKLYGEQKLHIIAPNLALADSYAQKSNSNIESARILHTANRFEESVSLIYYSMYNMVMSLLYLTGIKCENHEGAIALINDVFHIENSELIKAKKERIQKQYSVDFSINTTEVENAIDVAEQFNSKIANFSAVMDPETIEGYRTTLKHILAN